MSPSGDIDEWSITQLSPALGALIEGPDLARDQTAAERERLVELLAEHLVLVFRDQTLDAEQHVSFSTIFGDPYLHPFLDAVPEHPAILQVLKTEEDVATFGGEFWHVDISFTSPPAAVSLLHSFEIPSMGGDTLFANQFLAHDALSPAMAQMLDGLTAPHTYPDKAEDEPGACAVHPVVRTHPVSGRKAVYVNPAFVSRFSGMTEAESRPLLDFLFAHQTRPEFQARLDWEPNQLMVWDNRAVQHYALNDYPGERRRLQRVTVLERTP